MPPIHMRDARARGPHTQVQSSQQVRPRMRACTYNGAMRIPVLILLGAAAVAAQPLTFGVKAGVPFIDPFGPNGESRPFSGGAFVEVRLPAGFAIEASAVYRRVGVSYAYSLMTGASGSAV